MWRSTARRSSRKRMVVGITGGLASGKSAVTDLLRRRGALVFSADEASRAVMAMGGPVLARVAAEFGGVIDPNGALDRAALGRRIFADADARERLNSIVHPAVIRLLHSQIQAAREDFPGATVVVEVPLLFEANLSEWFERIVVVTASEPTQIARLAARNGLDEQEARGRIRAQWPITEKARRAHFVIQNEGSQGELDMAVERLWDKLHQPEPECTTKP